MFCQKRTEHAEQSNQNFANFHNFQSMVDCRYREDELYNNRLCEFFLMLTYVKRLQSFHILTIHLNFIRKVKKVESLIYCYGEESLAHIENKYLFQITNMLLELIEYPGKVEKISQSF